MDRAKVGMIVVAVPAAVESRVRVGVMDAVVRLVVDERGWLWSRGWDDTTGIDSRAQKLFDNAVRFVRDSRNGRMPLQDVFQPLVDRAVGRSGKTPLS